jgi:hypothetical protein
MKINATPPHNPTMGLNRVPTRRIYYLPNGFLEKDIVKLKDHTLLITRNYPNGELSSTLFYLKDQAGRWIKSKLKYFEDGMQKCIRSENKCLNG